MSRSQSLFWEANAVYEAALAEACVERLQSDARVARLRVAAELERQGRTVEAAAIVAEVRAEQENSA